MKKLKYWEAAGSILCGKAMLAQLTSELQHYNVKNPAMLCDPGQMKKARKASRLMISADFKQIPLSEGMAPSEADCLLLAGGQSLAAAHKEDGRIKVLIPLSVNDLESIEHPMTDFLVIDRAFIKDKKALASFFRRYASIISDGRAKVPGSLAIPDAFSYSCRTKVISGDSALNELPRMTRDLGMKKPMILSDKGIVAVGLFQRLTEALADTDYNAFDDIPPDSDSDTVNRISKLYGDQNNDGIIALGGGSVLDTAKGVYLNVSLDCQDLAYYCGSGRIPRLHTPFIAIPTTSGTGSEVTKVAVINDKKRERKILYVSPHLQPDMAILDPSLTASLPPFLTSITAMDALSHAVEAYTCLGKNPLSDQMAWKAIELIRDHLIPSVKDGTNLEHRMALAEASSLAGQAFSNSMVGMVHTIGHSVGSHCHVPHGSCMSVLLPHALEYNFQVIEPLLKELYAALADPSSAENIRDEEKAKASIQIIRSMNVQLRELTMDRHPLRLSHALSRDGGILVHKEDFEQIAETALGDASIAYNPVELRKKDILNILEAAY